MLDQLANKLQEVFKNLRGYGKLSEANVADACKQIRLALLEADVHFTVAREFVEKVRVRALGEEVLQSITPGQQFVKIFQDELASFFGEPSPLAQGDPLKILLCGLQGSGKTTTAGKLAGWLKAKGKKPMLVAADLQRPAAITQLESLAAQVGVPIHVRRDTQDPVLVCREALDLAKELGCNTIIFDTAGRLDLDEALLAQLTAVREAVSPQETLFVADAALGQKSVDIVTRFKQATPLTGLVLTRLDGDARGGAALSMRQVTGVPIKFIGTGEKLANIELLDPQRLASRVLGMGDVVGLVEKAQEAFDLENMQHMEEKLRKQQFDLGDFLVQLQQIKKLGPLENLLGMIPGAPKVKDSQGAEKQLRRTEAIILSMTPQERRKPDMINAKRRQRIARGSGTTVTAVNELLLQFQQMKKMMKNAGKMKKMLAQFGMKA